MREPPTEVELRDEHAAFLAGALALEDLASAGAADILRLLPKSGLFSFKKGAEIFRQDDHARDLFIICAGSVEILKTLGTAGARLTVLGAGMIFGEIALLTDGTRSATAIARESCMVFRLDAADLERLLKSRPALHARLKHLADMRLDNCR